VSAEWKPLQWKRCRNVGLGSLKLTVSSTNHSSFALGFWQNREAVVEDGEVTSFTSKAEPNKNGFWQNREAVVEDGEVTSFTSKAEPNKNITFTPDCWAYFTRMLSEINIEAEELNRKSRPDQSPLESTCVVATTCTS